MFVNAPDLQTAKPQLQKVRPRIVTTWNSSSTDLANVCSQIRGSRFTEKYLQSRYNSSFSRSSAYSDIIYPSLPPRPGSTPTSLGSSVGSKLSTSPPRRVISEFKPFSASGMMSVADAPLGVANENLPSAGAQTMEDDEVEKLAQSVELRFAGISLEQVRLASDRVSIEDFLAG